MISLTTFFTITVSCDALRWTSRIQQLNLNQLKSQLVLLLFDQLVLRLQICNSNNNNNNQQMSGREDGL